MIRDFIQTHRESNADITISVLPCDEVGAGNFVGVRVEGAEKTVGAVKVVWEVEAVEASWAVSIVGATQEKIALLLFLQPGYLTPMI